MLKELLEQHGLEVSHDADSGGTSYFYQFEMPYESLVELLGPPEENRAGDGTKAEWTLTSTEDGDTDVITVYDYMTGLTAEQNTHWNVGANELRFVYPLMDLLDAVREVSP